VTAADCGGKQCNPDGQCVDCTKNADCPAALPFCKDVTCVECQNDKDCPAGAPKCSNNVCTKG
jgi:Cys-rich repeat protein